MNETVLNTVEALRKNGDYQYILSKYVDSGYWFNKINNYFEEFYVENLTDFNYSTCFTIYLNISKNNFKVGTEEFNNYIRENQYLYRVKIQISAIAPYAIYEFIKYTYENQIIIMKSSFTPFIKEHYFLEDKVIEFLNMSNFTILDETLLSIEIPNISLEMRKNKVTVYHCLFEDEY